MPTRSPRRNPEVFDPEATLPSMRSGGLQLYVDGRGATVLDAIQQSKAFNDGARVGRRAAAAVLRRGPGPRLPARRVGLAHRASWHSLHRRSGRTSIGEDDVPFDDRRTRRGSSSSRPPSRRPGAEASDKDLYVHEVIARWAGLEPQRPLPGQGLSRYADPDKAIPPDGDDRGRTTDEPITAVQGDARPTRWSRHRCRVLRFGVRYRMRARAVDLAGNSLARRRPARQLRWRCHGAARAIPRAAPTCATSRWRRRWSSSATQAAVTGPGSAVHRLVMRTFNDGPATTTARRRRSAASDRHIVPPRTSVELGERHGHVRRARRQAEDRRRRPGTWRSTRDAGAVRRGESSTVAGKRAEDVPIEPADSIDSSALSARPAVARRRDPRSARHRQRRGRPRCTRRSGAAGAGRLRRPSATSTRVPDRRRSSSFNASADWQQTYRLPARARPSQPAAGRCRARSGTRPSGC